MSKPSTNNNEKRIQFVVKKESPDFKILEDIEKIYNYPKRSSKILQALKDLNVLYQFYGKSTISDLLKSIQEDIPN